MAGVVQLGAVVPVIQIDYVKVWPWLIFTTIVLPFESRRKLWHMHEVHNLKMRDLRALQEQVDGARGGRQSGTRLGAKECGDFVSVN